MEGELPGICELTQLFQRNLMSSVSQHKPIAVVGANSNSGERAFNVVGEQVIAAIKARRLS